MTFNSVTPSYWVLELLIGNKKTDRHVHSNMQYAIFGGIINKYNGNKNKIIIKLFIKKLWDGFPFVRHCFVSATMLSNDIGFTSTGSGLTINACYFTYVCTSWKSFKIGFIKSTRLEARQLRELQVHQKILKLRNV